MKTRFAVLAVIPVMILAAMTVAVQSQAAEPIEIYNLTVDAGDYYTHQTMLPGGARHTIRCTAAIGYEICHLNASGPYRLPDGGTAYGNTLADGGVNCIATAYSAQYSDFSEQRFLDFPPNYRYLSLYGATGGASTCQVYRYFDTNGR